MNPRLCSNVIIRTTTSQLHLRIKVIALKKKYSIFLESLAKMQFTTVVFGLFGLASIAMAAPTRNEQHVSAEARGIEKRCLYDSCDECYESCSIAGTSML